ncbi:hypothetical protein BC940DRAFT_322738 [Gongronella butleri]|nr:hypothetical protein BC940DRAFT_322738 [Gongronella butleri]
MICTLQGDITDSQQLNLCISKYDQIVHLCASGPSPIVVMGQLYDLGDDDEDDADFMLDEDDEEEDSTLQFRDPSDERFLGGFELHHFGLGEPTSPYMNDHINLREQEDNPEEAALHDRIVQGLINSMLNSGNQQQIAKAKKIKAKLSSKKARR